KGKKLRIDYEELVTHPSRVIDSLESFLGINFPETALQDYKAIDFSGRMGDPTKGRKYDGVKGNSVGGWKDFVSNPYRKKFLKQYVDEMPRVALEQFRIDRERLLS